MLRPTFKKIPTNSYLRSSHHIIYPIQSISSHPFYSQSSRDPLISRSFDVTTTSRHPTAPYHNMFCHQQHSFCVQTTAKRQAEILRRQKALQQQQMEAQGQQLQAVYPGDLSDDEDEYVPEVDWDHTRFESHYKRIWEQEPEPESTRERIYNFMLKMFVGGTWVVGAGCLLFGCFAWYKMKKQLRYVRGTQRSIRYMRKIYDQHLTALMAAVPLDLQTMDVSEIKEMLRTRCDVDDTHISMEALNAIPLWQQFVSLELPLNDIIDYEGDETMDIEDVTYFIAMLHYFLGQPRRKGTPSVRRQVRDDIYKMLKSYSGGEVTLKNMGSYACACFCLAIISPPNLGDETIGGQTLDEFKVNYCKYMLRDEEMQIDSPVTVRKFNFIYKICDFSIGLTPETRGQLSK